MIQDEDILDAYYLKQSAEQYFDLAKGYAILTLLRIHSEEMAGACLRPSDGHALLRSQNCRIYDDEIFVDEL